jgi:hypothetical protein
LKKVLFLCLLVLCFNLAHAAIEILRETKDGIAYVDPDSIAKANGLIKVTVLQDFHRMQSHADQSYLTSKIEFGFDCKINMVQQLAITLFPENMGNGTAVFSEQKAGAMVPVKAGSIEAAVMQKVCR